MKYKPRITVIPKPIFLPKRSLLRRLWWQYVTVTPEAKRTIVLRRGNWNGFKAFTPIGGQEHPNSGEGERLLWKKAQKKDKKNITSEIINKIIPIRRPVATCKVWKPKTVPSRATSRHHWKEHRNSTLRDKISKVKDFKWKKKTNPKVRHNAPSDLIIGQGLNSTKWNCWKKIIDSN